MAKGKSKGVGRWACNRQNKSEEGAEEGPGWLRAVDLLLRPCDSDKT